MRKFIYLFSVSLMCLIALSSCSTDSPEQVVRKFVEYSESGNSKKMIECLATATDKELDESQQKQAELAMAAMAEKAKKSFEEKKGIKDIETLSEEISEDNETATVEVKFNFGDGTSNTNSYQLVKQDGKWKIKF